MSDSISYDNNDDDDDDENYSIGWVHTGGEREKIAFLHEFIDFQFSARFYEYMELCARTHKSFTS